MPLRMENSCRGLARPTVMAGLLRIALSPEHLAARVAQRVQQHSAVGSKPSVATTSRARWAHLAAMGRSGVRAAGIDSLRRVCVDVP